MWINVGRQQIHLLSAKCGQKLRGTIGLVVPHLEYIKKSLENPAFQSIIQSSEWKQGKNGERFVELTGLLCKIFIIETRTLGESIPHSFSF